MPDNNSDSIYAAIEGYVRRSVQPLEKIIEAQATRIANLEARGPVIVRGIDGKDGAPGERGMDGPQGPAGKDGAPGERGAIGPPGPAGATGATGETGKDGAAGTHGLPGMDGAPGLQGKDGAPGAAGKDGAVGRDGVSFLSAIVDADGELVITASDGTKHKAGIIRGRDGRDGADGAPGSPGAAGRDAVAIRPLSGIEDAKSYPAGSWAIYGGGSWYAEKETEALNGRNPSAAGWTPLAVGEAKFDLAFSEDLRTITTSRTTSTGITFERRYAVPVVIDRGVYAAGREYARGDAVTRSGSLFIARVDGPAGLPGASDDWRLAVKAGKDATR